MVVVPEPAVKCVGAYARLNASQIRRDLAGLGKLGTRGLGYSVDGLLGEIRQLLVGEDEQPVALVGAACGYGVVEVSGRSGGRVRLLAHRVDSAAWAAAGGTVGQVRGAILVACATACVSCIEYPPASVKQAVCGYGRA